MEKKTRQFVTVGNYETLQISWDQQTIYQLVQDFTTIRSITTV